MGGTDMLTPQDPLLILWRSQKVHKHLTDEFIADAIAEAYERVDAIATRGLTAGARDLAASYIVRMARQHCDERQSLSEIVGMLTGGAAP
jgi:hypothetical protein